MLPRKVKFVGLGLTLLVLLVGGGIAARSGTAPRPAGVDSKDTKVKALLKERHATLQAIASLTTKQYERGTASVVQVAEANRTARHAELDLCDTDKERVAVLEKMLAEAKEYEKSAEQLHKGGSIPFTAALKAKADRLEVEIALERAKGK